MFLMLLSGVAKRQFQNMQNKFHLDIKCVSETNHGVFAIFWPLTGSKTLEEVLSFDLVSHVKIG